MIVRIYTLSDPNDGLVKYVGRTKNSLKTRMYGHLYKEFKNNTYKANWISKLRSENKRPVIEIVEELHLDDTHEAWVYSHEVEKYWIQQFQVWGFILTNYFDKGPGNIGKCWSESQHKKISKPVHQYDLDGNYVASYPSVKAAAKETGIHYKNIQGPATSNRPSGGGFMWSYKKLKKLNPYRRKNSTTFYQYSLDGDLIRVYYSGKSLKEHGYKRKNVVECSSGNLKTYSGCVWSTCELSKMPDVSRKKQTGKTIYQYTKDHHFVKEWVDAKTIEHVLKISAKGVRQVTTGAKKSFKGYIWSYEKY